MAVIEWCKLFSKKEEHGWQKIATDTAAFEAGLLSRANKTQSEFDTYYVSMRTYRDKFLAHLDSESMMHVPLLDVAKECISYYYEYLLLHENDGRTFLDGPADLQAYYDACYRDGLAFYG